MTNITGGVTILCQSQLKTFIVNIFRALFSLKDLTEEGESSSLA